LQSGTAQRITHQKKKKRFAFIFFCVNFDFSF